MPSISDTAAGETIARLARERNGAQDAARHAVNALAALDVTISALPGDASDEARADAATAAKALGRLVEYTRMREKAAQDRFWENWDAFRQGKSTGEETCPGGC